MKQKLNIRDNIKLNLLEITKFIVSEQRKLLGFQSVDGITVEGGNSMPPYVAFGFRTLKSNRRYRYVWLLKGTFSMGEMNGATREQNVTFQNQAINGTFLTRLCDAQIKIQIDSDDENFTQDIGDNWFKKETLNKLYVVTELGDD